MHCKGFERKRSSHNRDTVPLFPYNDKENHENIQDALYPKRDSKRVLPDYEPTTTSTPIRSIEQVRFMDRIQLQDVLARLVTCNFKN